MEVSGRNIKYYSLTFLPNKKNQGAVVAYIFHLNSL
jgi:hypothetical protein